MSRRSWIIDDEIIKSGETSGFSKNYEIVFKEVVSDFYGSGSEFVNIVIEIPEKLDAEGNPKRYKIERQTVTSGDSKGNAPTFWMSIFQSAFKLCHASNKIGKATAKVWDKEERAFVEKKVDQYVELLDKKIGAIVSMTNEFPQKVINGYSKQELSYEDSKGNPYAVWIPSYYNELGEKNKTYAKFSIDRFYSVAPASYGKTATEILDGKSAKEIEKRVKLLKEKETDPIEMSDEEMNEFIKGKLEYSLSKTGEAFDVTSWVDYGADIEIADEESEDDIPF